jgi:hypothetical protein
MPGALSQRRSAATFTKVAIAYAVVAWLLAEIATQIFPFFESPNWAVRRVVLFFIPGFSIA